VPDAEDITALSDATVERIAAGEVVERPASVVKELVENALDAGADRVAVTVEAGGTDLVRVRDDGEGMTREAVQRAVEPHTTSKIRDAADLDSGVGTLGFRGEALHTIGAVSRLAVTTRAAGEDVGTELVLAGGDVESVEATGRPVGTTVAVTDLFYNTPAREKYLGAERTEFGRVNDVVTNYALANPDVAVSLTHDGTETFATPGQGDLRGTLLAVYGREVAEAMVPVGAASEAGWAPGDAGAGGEDDATDGGDAAPDDGVAVAGYVSDPETTRSSRDYVSTFVNGRYVRSGAAREAVVEAYGGQLAADRYPFAVLFLTLPPGDVDPNVHPRKTEVRFADDDAVRERVGEAVREALLDHGLLRSGAPRGRSAPDEAAVDPGGTGEPEAPDDGETTAGKGTADDATGPSPARTAGRRSGGGAGAGWSSDAPGTDDGVASPGSAGTGGDTGAAGTGVGDPPDGAVPAADRPHPDPPAGGADDGGPATGSEQRTLTGGATSEARAYDALPELRVLGQYDDTYVVAATDDGLVLIDQHAADERVHYERLRAELADAPSQALAESVELELTAGEAAAFDDALAALREVGFDAEPTGERAVAVTAVPAVFDDALDPGLLRDVLARALGAGDPAAPVARRADALLADLACAPAVTGNTALTEGSVVDLLAALDDCENPWACPHGRPTLVRFDAAEIDGRFERDYPGHGERRPGDGA
jgi:DNA mismatch repair protein MutL